MAAHYAAKSSVLPNSPYGYPQSTWQPANYVTYTTPPTDLERFRFALELIAGGRLTKDAMVDVSKAALRKDAK